MEKRINKKIEVYTSAFKEKILERSSQLGIKDDQLNSLMQYIYDYESLSLKELKDKVTELGGPKLRTKKELLDFLKNIM
jgi:hypothetical protein